jgi:hypothetical protein
LDPHRFAKRFNGLISQNLKNKLFSSTSPNFHAKPDAGTAASRFVLCAYRVSHGNSLLGNSFAHQFAWQAGSALEVQLAGVVSMMVSTQSRCIFATNGYRSFTILRCTIIFTIVELSPPTPFQGLDLARSEQFAGFFLAFLFYMR